MKTDLPNPPAFPTVREYTYSAGVGTEHVEGMTLRDYFAGQALAGFVANDKLINTAISECTARHRDGDVHSTPEKVIAERCGKLADAMLAARAQTPPQP
jgi:predicted transcriptional regulator